MGRRRWLFAELLQNRKVLVPGIAGRLASMQSVITRLGSSAITALATQHSDSAITGLPSRRHWAITIHNTLAVSDAQSVKSSATTCFTFALSGIEVIAPHL